MKTIITAVLLISTFAYAKTNVVVSILPQKTFVEKIGGNKVNVTSMVKPGFDPHTYEPKPSQMIEVSKADIYFPIGIEFENVWLPKFIELNKKMNVIDMTKGISYIQMPKHNEHHNEHALHEEENSYEWAGLFNLKKSTYTWSFAKIDSKYADDKMKMLILRTDDNSEKGIEKLEKKANKIFSNEKAFVKHDLSVLNEINTLYDIEFNQKKELTKINIEIKKEGNYVIFTQHLPSEFENKEHFFKNNKNADIEAIHQEPESASHDAHNHAGNKDPHVWTSPTRVKLIAKNVYNALVKMDSRNKEYYKKNYIKFLNEISYTDNKIREIFLDLPLASNFMVFHPSWGYFAKDYSLTQLVIEIEGKEPKPKTLKRIIDEAREKNVKAIFAQKEFSDKSAKTIAGQLNIQVIKETPLASNWSENLINMAKAIADYK